MLQAALGLDSKEDQASAENVVDDDDVLCQAISAKAGCLHRSSSMVSCSTICSEHIVSASSSNVSSTPSSIPSSKRSSVETGSKMQRHLAQLIASESSDSDTEPSRMSRTTSKHATRVTLAIPEIVESSSEQRCKASSSTEHPRRKMRRVWDPIARFENYALSSKWAEWRDVFPLAELNDLADFYESLPPADETNICRLLANMDAQALAVRILDHPPQTFVELFAELAVGSASKVLRVASFPQFLEYVRAGIARALHAGQFVSQQKLMQMQVAFSAHSSSPSNRLPMSRLFRAVHDLNLHSLDVSKTSSQKTLAEATKVATSGRAVGLWNPSAETGTLSFQDFLCVLALACRAAEAELAANEFEHERAAQAEAGFSQEEIEDLRELHVAYVASGSQVGATALSRFAALLRRCGARELSEADVRILRKTVRSAEGECASLPALPRDVTSGMTPFHEFTLWMRDVFQHKIAGLARSNKGNCGSQAVHERKGFLAAFLRDNLRRAKLIEEGHIDIRNVVSSQAPSHIHSCASSQRTSRAASPERVEGAEPHTCTQEGTHVSLGHKRKSIRRSTLAAMQWISRTDSGKRAKGQSNGSRRRPRSLCRSHSDGSRASSRASSPGRALPAINTTSSADAGKVHDGSGTIVMPKGLPPCEAMLARRMIRACSVELNADEVATLNGPNTAAEVMAEKAHESMLRLTPVSAFKAALTAEKSTDTPSDLSPASPVSPPRRDRLSQPKAVLQVRKVKPAQDSDDLVRQAIVKLACQDSEHEEE